MVVALCDIDESQEHLGRAAEQYPSAARCPRRPASTVDSVSTARTEDAAVGTDPPARAASTSKISRAALSRLGEGFLGDRHGRAAGIVLAAPLPPFLFSRQHDPSASKPIKVESMGFAHVAYHVTGMSDGCNHMPRSPLSCKVAHTEYVAPRSSMVNFEIGDRSTTRICAIQGRPRRRVGQYGSRPQNIQLKLRCRTSAIEA